MDKLKNGLNQASGWMLYLSLLMLLALALPRSVFDPESRHFLLLIGIVGIWRYSMGAMHFVRGCLFLYLVYPWYRRKVKKLGKDADPSHVFLLVTSFRIEALTTAMVYRSVIREAIDCRYPCTVVCSIVELSDELLIKNLWAQAQPPAHVTLDIVRIPGTGKRDGLAHGFRAISRQMPDRDAVVAVIDGDTVLEPGVVRKSVPWFKLFPNVGGLTTNEFCEVRGSYLMSEWHKLRFAQRHLNMCSMALSKRVLTMTGRMSVFRASVVTDPEFIRDVESDHLEHWRLGRFQFLTGDDKSSWFSLMRAGWDTFYVPDSHTLTVEHPPDNSFLRATRQLMYRWYGNSLRQNFRATRLLGSGRLGLFTMYVLYDQRVSMWTCLMGLSASVVAGLLFGIQYLLLYLFWVLLSRTLVTLLFFFAKHPVHPMYPFVLYYNQIVGSVMKIYAMFHLDQQSWTRQKTTLANGNAAFDTRLNKWSSKAMLVSSIAIFFSAINLLLHITQP